MSDRKRALQDILRRTQTISDEMGISRGTLLLILAVGALTAEEMEDKDIHTAVDFIFAGLELQMEDIEF